MGEAPEAAETAAASVSPAPHTWLPQYALFQGFVDFGRLLVVLSFVLVFLFLI